MINWNEAISDISTMVIWIFLIACIAYVKTRQCDCDGEDEE